MTFMEFLVKHFVQETNWDFAVCFGSTLFVIWVLIVCSPRRPRSER